MFEPFPRGPRGPCERRGSCGQERPSTDVAVAGLRRQGTQTAVLGIRTSECAGQRHARAPTAFGLRSTVFGFGRGRPVAPFVGCPGIRTPMLRLLRVFVRFVASLPPASGNTPARVGGGETTGGRGEGFVLHDRRESASWHDRSSLPAPVTALLQTANGPAENAPTSAVEKEIPLNRQLPAGAGFFADGGRGAPGKSGRGPSGQSEPGL